MKIAVCQTNSGIDPAENAIALVSMVETSGEAGAKMVFTPEMSGLLDRNGTRAAGNIEREIGDKVLSALQKAAGQSQLCN
jgi:deaminated glutathione amidase